MIQINPPTPRPKVRSLRLSPRPELGPKAHAEALDAVEQVKRLELPVGFLGSSQI